MCPVAFDVNECHIAHGTNWSYQWLYGVVSGVAMWCGCVVWLCGVVSGVAVWCG